MAENHFNNTQISEEERAMRAVFDFARCAVIEQNKFVRRLVEKYSLEFEPSDSRRLYRPRCLWGGDLTIPNAMMRGALFRSLYIEDFGTDTDVRNLTDVDYAQYFDELETSPYRSSYVMLDFASCVIAKDYAAARDYVVSTPGDESEAGALETIIPLLGPCLPGGLQVEFSKAMLSAYLSEAIYRETEAAMSAMELSEAAQ